MKKIISLLLVVMMLLPTFPVLAASAEIIAPNYNLTTSEMLVTVKSSSSFSTAVVSLLKGDTTYTSCTIAGGAAGSYTGVMNLNNINLPEEGEYTLRAVFDGNQTSAVTKNIYIYDGTTTVDKYKSGNMGVNNNSGKNDTFTSSDDGYTMKASFSADQLTVSGADKCVYHGAYGSNKNLGSNYILEFETEFDNINPTYGVEISGQAVPNVYAAFTLRQDTTYHTNGYPLDGSKLPTKANASEAGVIGLFLEGGKVGSATSSINYYTNTEYKVRVFLDMVTTKTVNEVEYPVGNLTIYIAEKSGDTYGSYKLVKEIKNFTLYNIASWRLEMRCKNAPGSMTLKNITLTCEKPNVSGISVEDLIRPKQGQHPYILINDEYVSGLTTDGSKDVTKLKPEYQASYQTLRASALSSLPAQNGYLSSSAGNRLAIRALMYALGLEPEVFTKDFAKQTIDYTIEYLKSPKSKETIGATTNTISEYKDFGDNGIRTGSLVLDWCWDAFESDEERQTLSKEILAMYDIKREYVESTTKPYVQPCRPDNTNSWTHVAGYAVGEPVIYNAIAAIALYDTYDSIRDELPESYPTNLYDSVMGTIQGNMAKAVKGYGEAGALSDGSISYTREYYSYQVYMIIKRLGATDAQMDALYGDQTPIGYKMLYSRLPYGSMIKQGDSYDQFHVKMNVYGNATETVNLGLLASMYPDSQEAAYFRFNYLKENQKLSSFPTSFLNFLIIDNEVTPQIHDDLPLAFKTSLPRTEIMAKTSWQEGMNSPAVTAYMNMNERRTGDHDHSQIGEFQLYYKGPLTIPGGFYYGVGWGEDHWKNYYTRSVAANCMLLYDPNETYTFSGKTVANDGGQKMISINNKVTNHFGEAADKANRWATTEGAYIGPNAKTPAFSYLKGDITKAYSSHKMDSYKRSMVFMDTFNETYPGVMIVFDRMVSKDASFKKKWLLQSVTEPTIDDTNDKITIVNQLDGANGKLVNTTLLPENVNIKKVGGRLNYIPNSEKPDEAYNYIGNRDEEYNAAEAYRSGIRLEVTPATQQTEDIFLNAMYVTDADGNAADLNMTKISAGNFVGVQVLDRTVLFSVNGERIQEQFTLNLGRTATTCLITDIKEGNWNISGSDGTSIVVKSNPGEGCLVFEAKRGVTYTISPSSSATVTAQNWAEAAKEKIGDFVIKLDTGYIYLPDETYLKNGVPYISAKTAEQLAKDVTATVNGNSATFTNGSNTYNANAGDAFYTVNNIKIPLANPVISHNNTVYIPITEMQGVFSVSGSYVPSGLVLKLTSGSSISTQNYLPMTPCMDYVEKESLLHNLSIGETVSFGSEGYDELTYTPLVYDFGSVKKIEKLEIHATQTVSGIKLYYSVDGKNFYRYACNSSGGKTVVITPNEQKAVRYIKIVPQATINISEIAAYGTDYDKKAELVDKTVTIVDANKEFNIPVYLESGFSVAKLYFGGTEVADFVANSSNAYNAVVPSTTISSQYGTRKITLKAVYNGNEYSDTHYVNIVKGKDNLQFANVDFNTTAFGNVFKGYSTTKTSCVFDRNFGSLTADDAEQSLDGEKYNITFKKAIGTPFVHFNTMLLKENGQTKTVENGVYEAKFDLITTTPDIRVIVEARTKYSSIYTSDNPLYGQLAHLKTGDAYDMIQNEKGHNEFTLEFDTINNHLRIYKRAIDEATGERAAERVLIKEDYIESDGIGHIRLCFVNRSITPATVSIDNFSVNYRELYTTNKIEAGSSANTVSVFTCVPAWLFVENSGGNNSQGITSYEIVPNENKEFAFPEGAKAYLWTKGFTPLLEPYTGK